MDNKLQLDDLKEDKRGLNVLNILSKIVNKIKNEERKLYLIRKRRHLKNTNPTIISNNCLGGVISHDLGIRFNSPCVNQGMIAKDYIKFLKKMDYYLSLKPKPLGKLYRDTNFAMTQLGDIVSLFAHEESVEVSISKWEKRKGRINKDNMYVIMTDALECTYEDIMEFDKLPFPHKIIFTHKPYPEFESVYFIKGYEDESEIGVLSDWKPTFWQRRYIDDFDYVTFLNQ